MAPSNHCFYAAWIAIGLTGAAALNAPPAKASSPRLMKFANKVLKEGFHCGTPFGPANFVQVASAPDVAQAKLERVPRPIGIPAIVPYVYYRPDLFHIPSALFAFTLHHECAHHLNGHTFEILQAESIGQGLSSSRAKGMEDDADCEALKWIAQNELFDADDFKSLLGSLSKLPGDSSHRAGSDRARWVQSCPGAKIIQSNTESKKPSEHEEGEKVIIDKALDTSDSKEITTEITISNRYPRRSALNGKKKFVGVLRSKIRLQRYENQHREFSSVYEFKKAIKEDLIAEWSAKFDNFLYDVVKVKIIKFEDIEAIPSNSDLKRIFDSRSEQLKVEVHPTDNTSDGFTCRHKVDRSTDRIRYIECRYDLTIKMTVYDIFIDLKKPLPEVKPESDYEP